MVEIECLSIDDDIDLLNPSDRVSFHAYLEFSSAMAQCFSGIDAEMALVSLSLLALCLVLLSSRISLLGLIWRQNISPVDCSVYTEKHDESEGEEGVSSNRTVSTHNSNTVEEEDSDEEKFEKMWPVIRSSTYRRLVLPPECKLVQMSLLSKRQKDEQRKNRIERNQHMDFNDSDHPLIRLKLYSSQVQHLLRSFLSYDYINAGQLLIDWIHCWFRLRQRKVEESEDDDDNVADIASKSTRVEGLEFEPTAENGDDRKSNNDVYFNDELFDDHKYDALSSNHIKIREEGKNLISCHRAQISTVKEEEVPSKTPTVRSKLSQEFDDPDEIGIHSRTSDSLAFFDAAHSKESLRKLHVQVPVPDRNGYILGDEFLQSSRHTPLLVFVNSRSGPQQGSLLVGQFCRLLNPIQVWDLANGSPERVLESFCILSRLRILVCGGDGTVSWIISCLEKMKLERWPPIAILPLGTGNDLARIHGWGSGYNNESLLSILEQVSDAYISLLDRWEMKIENKKGRAKVTKSFFNYVGVGADAQAALQVHMLRESKPNLFFSRMVNKMWYLLFGAEEVLKESNINLPNEISLIADGIEVPLPADSQGIVLLNVDSFAGGVPIWSDGVKEENSEQFHPLSRNRNSQSFLYESSHVGLISPRRVRSMSHLTKCEGHQAIMSREDSMEDFHRVNEVNKYEKIFACNRPSSCQDGILDVVSVRGTFHLGQIRVGLSNATRVCQASEIKVIIKKKVAVQIDGEPWRQEACTITITRKQEPAVMLHRSAHESGGMETEMAKLLDWAEDRKIIDRNVHDILMKEFSRRIESKTRKRRVKSQENLMVSLKRAVLS